MSVRQLSSGSSRQQGGLSPQNTFIVNVGSEL